MTLSISLEMETTQNSFSGTLMSELTRYRNQHKNSYGSLVCVQTGYIALPLIASVESVAHLAGCLGSCMCYPSNVERSVKRLQSSSFSIIWSLAGFVFNPISDHLIDDEEEAMDMFKNRKIHIKEKIDTLNQKDDFYKKI